MNDLHPLTVFCQQHVGLPLPGAPLELPLVAPTAGRAALCQLFKALGFTRGAEIGVWTGEFSAQMCAAIPGLQLCCVDPWQAYDAYHEKKNDQARLDEAYGKARRRLQPYACQFMRMTSLEAARQVPDHALDFVYIDGNHLKRFVLEDLAAWSPKVRRGGIVAGHDCVTRAKHTHIEVEAAVREFVQAKQIDAWFILTADPMPSFFWMVR